MVFVRCLNVWVYAALGCSRPLLAADRILEPPKQCSARSARTERAAGAQPGRGHRLGSASLPSLQCVRIATWNCCSGPALPKLELLEAGGIDVAVLCEAPLANPRASATLLDHRVSWVSVGGFPTKSLAIAGLTTTVTALDARPAGRWTVAADTDGGPAVLGLWSAPSDPGAAAYGEQVVRSLEAYADLLAAGEMIVAGDFNIGQFVPAKETKDWTLRARAQWESLGLVSAYHAFTKEPFGSASRATHYHRRKQDQPFHIDYVLVPAARVGSINSVEIGSYEDWVAAGWSDHVPVIIDLDW